MGDKCFRFCTKEDSFLVKCLAALDGDSMLWWVDGKREITFLSESIFLRGQANRKCAWVLCVTVTLSVKLSSAGADVSPSPRVAWNRTELCFVACSS